MNMKIKTNNYVFWKVIIIVIVVILLLGAGIPALLSGIFTIPSLIIIAVLYLYNRRQFRSFETIHGVSVPKFYKAVWADKKNRTLQEVIDELKPKEV